jgi:hypothetical protein
MRLPRPLFLVFRTLIYLLLTLLLIRGATTFLPKAPPPAVAQQPEPTPKAPEPDPPGLQGLPALFAAEYLTWDSAVPQERAARLAPYLLPGIDPQAGWRPATQPTRQTAQGAWTLATQPDGPGRWLATVAARVTLEPTLDTSPKSRTLYLSVPLALTKSGDLAVAGLPALLPLPPAHTAAAQPPEGETVQDERAGALLPTFFTAYFSGANTRYFLTPEGHLDASPSGFTLKEVGKAELRKQAGNLIADVTVTATENASGATFTFHYTLRLTEREGRLYIQDLLQKGA